MNPTRLKYTETKTNYHLKISNIFGKWVFVTISKSNPHVIALGIVDDKSINRTRSSLQNAKRLVRILLVEEFEVNLNEEVRKKLCI